MTGHPGGAAEFAPVQRRRPERIANDDPLLAGAETEAERRARRQLVRELLDEGVPREELLDAVDSDRLSLRRTGLTLAQLDEFRRAAGLSPAQEITNADLVAATALSQLLAAGISAEDIV